MKYYDIGENISDNDFSRELNIAEHCIRLCLSPTFIPNLRPFGLFPDSTKRATEELFCLKTNLNIASLALTLYEVNSSIKNY